MTVHILSTDGPRRRTRRETTVEFGIIYAISFVVLLALVLVRRALDVLTWRTRSEPTISILREAREAAGATVPYAFMG